jgi:hypothetical protein
MVTIQSAEAGGERKPMPMSGGRCGRAGSTGHRPASGGGEGEEEWTSLHGGRGGVTVERTAIPRVGEPGNGGAGSCPKPLALRAFMKTRIAERQDSHVARFRPLWRSPPPSRLFFLNPRLHNLEAKQTCPVHGSAGFTFHPHPVLLARTHFAMVWTVSIQLPPGVKKVAKSRPIRRGAPAFAR